MKILQRIRASLASWSGNWQSLTGGRTGVSARLHLPGIARPAENVLAVYACMRARIAAIQQARLRISQGDGLVTGGDLFDLLERPALDIDGAQWLGIVEMYLTLYDMAFVAKVAASPDANPDELIPLPPPSMRPVIGVHAPTGTARAIGWVYHDMTTGKQTAFRPDELIIVAGFNPHAPLRALAPTDAAMRTMQADLAARESNLALFLNGGAPSIVLETDKTVTKEQADEMLSRFMDKYSGFANAHKPALLYNGLKAAKHGLTPQELQFLDGLRMTTSEILMAFRVMPAMVGVLTGETGLSQGTSTQEQKLAWWEDVGMPELERIASAIQHGLVDRHDWTVSSRAATRVEGMARTRALARAGRSRGAGLEVWFDENQIPALVKHRLAKVETLKTILGFGWEPDAVSELLDLGLPPHPTNVGMIPLGVQAVTDLSAPNQTAAPARAGGETSWSLPASGGAGKLERALRGVEAALAGREDDGANRLAAKHAKARKRFQGLVTRHTKVGARKVSGFFVEQRGRVLARLHKERAEGQRATAQELLAAIFPKAEEDAAIVKRLLGPWTEALRDGWELLGMTTGTANPFQIDDPRIVEALAARKIQAAKINATTEEDLRAILAAGIEAGESNAQIGDRIAEYYGKHVGETSARPQTAARTQMAGIVNEGQQAAARSAGGGLKKIWIHGAPEESRPAHVDAEQRYAAGIDLDDPFVINGVEMDAPGDATADIAETANCTCMVGYIAANEENEQ